MLIGLRQAQFTEITPAPPRTKNRLPSVLTEIRPVLERVFAGEILSRTLVLDSLIHYEGPTKLAAAGRGRGLKWMRNRAKKDPAALVDAIFAALAERTVTVPGTAAAELVIPQLAANIKALQAQRDTIAGQVEEMLESFPLAQVLMSMPGVGIKTASNIVLSIGDCQDFADAAHLAAYADHPAVGYVGPRRVSHQGRQKTVEKRAVSIGVDRVALPSRIARLLPA